jgi:hypothetical protein
MENQVEPSVQIPQFNPEDLEEMKKQARELAIQQVLQRRTEIQQQQQMTPVVPQQRNLMPNLQGNQKRSLTVAEILLMFVLSCLLVSGLQAGWHAVSNILPSIEIKMKK